MHGTAIEDLLEAERRRRYDLASALVACLRCDDAVEQELQVFWNGANLTEDASILVPNLSPGRGDSDELANGHGLEHRNVA